MIGCPRSFFGRSLLLAVGCVLIVTGVGASACQADFILDLKTPINGDVPNGFLRASFQTVTAGTATTVGNVKLTLDTSFLTAGEYVAGWGFNVDPTLPGFPGSMTVTRNGGTAPVIPITTTKGTNISNINNATKGGLFDLVFTFNSAAARRFKFSDTLIFDITGLNLTAETFKFLSAPDGNNPGGYASAADIRGFTNPSGGSGSGSIGAFIDNNYNVQTPEPSSIVLAIGGLIPMGVVAWRRKRQSSTER
jgi:hypothetical protein